MIRVKVRFFAMLQEVTGVEAIELELPEGATGAVFWKQIIARYPALEAYRHQSRLAVNQEYVPAEVSLKDGDEVSIIPPVSGG
ncbi:MAG: molybdopterin converting factor subunit 1 [Calditrichaeota bacterium]|nr:molybdopterin converting factor subunit 1 [Calditrichota bacterium]